MATIFTISDSESEPEHVRETDQSAGVQRMGDALGHSLTVPELRTAAGGRLRVNSESLASGSAERDGDLQAWGPAGEEGGGAGGGDGGGAPFRGRSRSAPPALWAAKKYGRQLRRMSDEFDTWLDKGEMKRVRSAGTARQMQQSPSWWSFLRLFSHKETDGETNHNTTTT